MTVETYVLDNMIYNEHFAELLLSSLFSGTLIKKWYKKLYYYVTDSKYGTKTRLDFFLRNQIKDPDKDLLKLAISLRVYDHNEDVDYDATIINILKYVIKNIKYESDLSNYGRYEFWAEASMTLQLKKDDCDGMNGLIWVLGRLAGIPDMILYCCIGDVNGGGHFWLNYWSPQHDKLVVIDSTYYPSIDQIKDRDSFVLSKTGYINIWYVFNSKMVYKPE